MTKILSLLSIKPNLDNIIETKRARLHIKVDNKLFSMNILNICILPIHKGDKNNERI